MKQMRMIVWAWALCAGAVFAQNLEIITLRHRPAEQLLPQLQPLLVPGAALTGRGDNLFLRTTPANAEEIRQALAVLDRPLRRLLISVRHAGSEAQHGGGVVVSGEFSGPQGRVVIGGGDGRTVTRSGGFLQGSVTETRRTRTEGVAQQVQTVEGGQAWINVGRSVPVAVRQVVQTPRGPVVSDSVSYREIGSGFFVEPRVAGDRVTLAISTANDSQGSMPGSTEVRHLVSTVAGRLGEWISLGGSVQQVTQDRRGLTAYAASGTSDDRQVWLMVEEVP